MAIQLSVFAETTSTESNTTPTIDSVEAAITQTDTQETSSSTTELSTTPIMLPVNNVTTMPLSSDWTERLEDIGIAPDSFLRYDTPAPSQKEKDELMASRYYFMGWYYMESDQPGRAIEQFTEALKEDPENTHVLLDAARAHLEIKEVEPARDLATKVLDRESTNVEALRVRAEVNLVASDSANGEEKEKLLKEAVEFLETARKTQPSNLDVLKILAKVYIQQQNVTKVIETYREIVKVDPRDTYSLLVLAQVISRMDNPADAIQYYQRVIEQRRSFIGGYIYLGQLYERLKRYNDALDLYKQAILVEPRNNDILRRFEDVLRQVNGQKNMTRILEAYKKFVDEYPANTEVRRIYAERLQMERKVSDAIVQYEAILKIDPENSDILLALSKIYSEQKKFDQSAEMLKKAVEVNPDKIDLYDEIVKSYLARNETDGAIKVYRKAVDANPNSERLYISLAALLEDDKQTTEAVKVIKAAISKVGEKPELLAVLGKFYRSLGNNSDAESTLRKAYEKEGDNLPLFGELLSVYLADNNLKAAEEITSRTYEKASVSKDVLLTVAAEFYYNAGFYDQAIDLYKQGLTLNSSKLEYLARLVGLSNRSDKFENSLEYIEHFGKKISDQSKVEQLRAETLLSAERYDESIAIYRELIRKNPYELDLYGSLVDAYNSAKKYDDSLKVVQEAQEKIGKRDPNSVLPLMMMNGMIYYKAKRYPEAERALNEVIKKSGDKADEAHYFLGSVYLDQKKYEKAETQFRDAIELNPSSSNALNALGYMFVDRNIKLKEAEDLIDKALDLNPNAPHILDSKGWLLYRKGDYKGAEQYILKALKPHEDPELLDHLAEIYTRQGKIELARETYKRVLELEPERPDTQKRLEALNGQNKK